MAARIDLKNRGPPSHIKTKSTGATVKSRNSRIRKHKGRHLPKESRSEVLLRQHHDTARYEERAEERPENQVGAARGKEEVRGSFLFLLFLLCAARIPDMQASTRVSCSAVRRGAGTASSVVPASPVPVPSPPPPFAPATRAGGGRRPAGRRAPHRRRGAQAAWAQERPVSAEVLGRSWPCGSGSVRTPGRPRDGLPLVPQHRAQPSLSSASQQRSQRKQPWPPAKVRPLKSHAQTRGQP